MQYTENFFGCKNEIFSGQILIFFLFLLKTYIVVHNLCFGAKVRKKWYTPAYPSFTIIKVGFKGVFIACFPDDSFLRKPKRQTIEIIYEIIYNNFQFARSFQKFSSLMARSFMTFVRSDLMPLTVSRQSQKVTKEWCTFRAAQCEIFNLAREPALCLLM